MSHLLNKIISRLFSREKEPAPASTPEEEVLLQTLLEYTELIAKFIPYYHFLSNGEKRRFIRRTWHFRNAKRFHFVDMEPQETAPVLVSAAAVQLTFGLRKYRLLYFRDIYIMPDAYKYEGARELYIGHVVPGSIHISWNHFLHGFADSSDNVNVAIHEMAHALAYDHFFDTTEIDHEFRSDFSRLPSVFGPEIAGLVVKRQSYLRSYAFTNIQEFWAVSVEAFFENPSSLKDNMPGLYAVISEILNQDPQATFRGHSAV